MSHIPNAAMPHAIPSEPESEPGFASRVGKRLSGAADKAKDHPKSTIAAGAAVVAAAVAVAAIPALRGRGTKAGTRSKGGSAKSGGGKSRAKTA